MDTHCYVGLQNLALPAAPKADLVAALQQLGMTGRTRPCEINHWRVRPDNNAVIFEALFDADSISVTNIKAQIARVLGIDAATIDHSINMVTFAARQSAVVTFSRNGTNYLRMVFFGYAGGDWPTWGESHVEVLAYLAANKAAWDSETP